MLGYKKYELRSLLLHCFSGSRSVAADTCAGINDKPNKAEHTVHLKGLGKEFWGRIEQLRIFIFLRLSCCWLLVSLGLHMWALILFKACPCQHISCGAIEGCYWHRKHGQVSYSLTECYYVWIGPVKDLHLLWAHWDHLRLLKTRGKMAHTKK